MSNHNSSDPNRYPRALTVATLALIGASAITIASGNNAEPVDCEVATVATSTSDTIDALMPAVDGPQTGAASGALAKLVRPQPTDTEIRVCSSGGNVSATALTDGAITYTVTNEGYATNDTVEPDKK